MMPRFRGTGRGLLRPYLALIGLWQKACYHPPQVTRENIVLAALASAGNSPFTPVQVQKLLFLIDRQIPARVGGPHFAFRPYHYGPFDRAVYGVLEELQEKGLVDIQGSGTWRSFALTDAGERAGGEALSSMDPDVQDFVRRSCEFVRTLSFSALVSAIYKAFPDMRTNSVFQG